LKGLKSNLYDILPQYDVFVMSSHFEGQPVALLEAMACGLPALLSDIPVLKEVGRASALYFDLADPEDFVTRVKEVANRQHYLEAMSQQGYQFALEHARKDSYMNKLKSLYTL
jgi:glycosyltransferase involved in cell wall biosynthesis